MKISRLDIDIDRWIQAVLASPFFFLVNWKVQVVSMPIMNNLISYSYSSSSSSCAATSLSWCVKFGQFAISIFASLPLFQRLACSACSLWICFYDNHSFWISWPEILDFAVLKLSIDVSCLFLIDIGLGSLDLIPIRFWGVSSLIMMKYFFGHFHDPHFLATSEHFEIWPWHLWFTPSIHLFSSMGLPMTTLNSMRILRLWAI